MILASGACPDFSRDHPCIAWCGPAAPGPRCGFIRRVGKRVLTSYYLGQDSLLGVAMFKYPNLRQERALWRAGYRQIAGLDEVGRGSWAGPVVAAAVILPLENRGLARQLRGVRDSKLLTPKARESLYPEIRSQAAAVGVGMVPQEGIDALGIIAATQLAMASALDSLGLLPHYLLIDALHLDYASLPHKSLINGDNRCLSIAAASIIAKVERDRLMRALDGKYPGYGFAHNKGYGTPQHRRALHRLGLTEIHRLSFHPMRDMKGLSF